MKTKINNVKYQILEVDKVVFNEEDDKLYFGCCSYEKERIEILSTLSLPKRKSTLAHELTHAYLFENGHTKDAYTLEDVCDLFGAYAENIVDTVNKCYKER